MHIIIQTLDRCEVIVPSENLILEKFPKNYPEDPEDPEDTEDTRNGKTEFEYRFHCFRLPEINLIHGTNYLKISLSEYQRIKDILKFLNGEITKAIEVAVANESVKKELKESMNTLFRMEL